MADPRNILSHLLRTGDTCNPKCNQTHSNTQHVERL